MSSDTCSRGIYGCKHDEGHIPHTHSVLKYFEDHDGYVLSKNINSHFGCCTRERTEELSAVLSYLEYESGEIKRLAGGAWGLTGSEHPKVQKQKALQMIEMPTGKIHLKRDGVMIHDREGRLQYDYVATEDEEKVTCGLCLQILRAEERKLERR